MNITFYLPQLLVSLAVIVGMTLVVMTVVTVFVAAVSALADDGTQGEPNWFLIMFLGAFAGLAWGTYIAGTMT